MAWIESHQTLAAHPKTRKLAMMLGISKPAAIGHLHCFWWWALDYAEDGSLDNLDDLDIAIGAEWDGDASTFVNAMVSVGFIDEDNDGRFIHDWHDYAGKLVDRRKANAKRMREARAAANADSAEHVQGTQRARVELPNQTQPNPTKPDHTKPTTSAKPKSVDARFEAWYAAYPSKVGRQKAHQAFQKIDWKQVDFDDMMAALERHKQSDQWTKDNGKFIPHPTTYLNRGGWEDQLQPAKPASSIAEPKGYSDDPDEAEKQMKRQLAEMQRKALGGTDGQIIPIRREA